MRMAASVTFWVKPPSGPVPSTKPTNVQPEPSSPGGHSRIWTKSEVNPAPVARTAWPSTRSVSGVIVRVGGTTSLSGSKAIGPMPTLRVLRPPSAVTTTTHASGSRQSTTPLPVSMRAVTCSLTVAVRSSAAAKGDDEVKSQSALDVGLALHRRAKPSSSHTRPAAATVTSWPSTSPSWGSTVTVGGGAKGASGAKPSGTSIGSKPCALKPG
jgi:hypothetical protein